MYIYTQFYIFKRLELITYVGLSIKLKIDEALFKPRYPTREVDLVV